MTATSEGEEAPPESPPLAARLDDFELSDDLFDEDDTALEGKAAEDEAFDDETFEDGCFFSAPRDPGCSSYILFHAARRRARRYSASS
mmetsp:Transcript_28676/g.80152  ORF Transcript_28676/g.80152 Transcript_28676/m.80152 type:complete len:88 (-) Transcript_28676:356-619(-)